MERIQMMGDQLLKIHVLIVLLERILQKLEQLNAHHARLALPHLKKSLLPILAFNVRQVLIHR
jgi:hypothetical protein